jgi:hypothetical protein
LFGYGLKVSWVDFSGLTILNIFDTADEIVALQLEVEG